MGAKKVPFYDRAGTIINICDHIAKRILTYDNIKPGTDYQSNTVTNEGHQQTYHKEHSKSRPFHWLGAQQVNNHRESKAGKYLKVMKFK